VSQSYPVTHESSTSIDENSKAKNPNLSNYQLKNTLSFSSRKSQLSSNMVQFYMKYLDTIRVNEPKLQKVSETCNQAARLLTADTAWVEKPFSLQRQYTQNQRTCVSSQYVNSDMDAEMSQKDDSSADFSMEDCNEITFSTTKRKVKKGRQSIITNIDIVPTKRIPVKTKRALDYKSKSY